ncbi:MAG: hypothetical protein F9K30_07800 [Dechloromonas sp.]|nr:MAG: hypothetical protein F9K30_07800 [Dechloromonas sp.]
MRPNINAEANRDKHNGLGELSECLAELATAMEAGQWEKLPPLIDRLERAKQLLSALPPGTAETSRIADEMRQALQKISELQTQAKIRQQQIQPLLQSWQGATKDGPTTP